MDVTEQEILELRKIIAQLNAENCPIVVEGKRDAAALKKLGLNGKILIFQTYGGMVKFSDAMAKSDRIVLLFDADRKGRYLTGKAIELLERRTKIDLSYKRRLRKITKGKIKFIEQLTTYEI